MITNKPITIYHKEIDSTTKLESYKKIIYQHCWVYEKKKVSTNQGSINLDNLTVRVPYHVNRNANISDFNLNDIIIVGELNFDIEKPSDLSRYKRYTITNITNNTFGSEKHIHIGAN